MIIANRSIHIIDYENNRILSRDIPATFDEYVGELIEHINRNDSVRDYKTRSRYTEVISGAIAISSQKDNADVVRERTNSIANRLLVKEVEAQGHIGRLNTNVQKGSLIQALLFDEQEHKHVYLLAKVEHSTFVDDVDFSFKTGFSKDKKTIWKSCLIDLPPEESDEYYAKVYSNTSAKFWSDDFLELDEMISDETNTLKSFKAIETVLNTNLRGVATKDLYGDNVIEKHGINRDSTGDREKTRYLCGKQGIFTRDRALIRPGFIRQLETRASTRSASFFHALGSPGRPHNGGGEAGAYRTRNGAKPLKQGHLRAKRGPLGPSRKSQQQTKRTGFAAHGHSIAETAPEGKRASCANGALIRA